MVPASYSLQTCAQLAVCPSCGGFTSSKRASVTLVFGASRSGRRLVLGQVSVCVSPFRATSRGAAPCWFAQLLWGLVSQVQALAVGASEAGYTAPRRGHAPPDGRLPRALLEAASQTLLLCAPRVVAGCFGVAQARRRVSQGKLLWLQGRRVVSGGEFGVCLPAPS